MPRLVLIGLGNEDVDVLSRIPKLDPPQETIVLHPDPGALVLKLAAIANLPCDTKPVMPRSDDVLVAPAHTDHVADWLLQWQALGARVIPTSMVGAVPLSDPRISKRDEKVAVTSTRERDSMAHNDVDLEQASAPASPPPAIWESPEATFRYLVEQAGGGTEDGVTVWWDGEAETWVPWLWMGAGPHGGGDVPAEAVELASSLGAFRLVAPEAIRSRLNLGAVGRVAEDAALRDLVFWKRGAGELRGLGRPDPSGDAEQWERWAGPVFKTLNPQASLVWKRGHDRWLLTRADGEGVEFSGQLVLPEDLLASTFETREGPWMRWDPAEDVRAHLIPRVDDPHFSLRVKRVEIALRGEDNGW